MAVTLALQTQITALQARIDAVAENASPEDVVMLAKAIEAISGQATVFDVIAYGDAQKSALAHALTQALAALEAQLAAASSQLGETTQAQLAQVVAQAQALRAEFDAALETFAAFEGATADTPGSLGMVPAPPASLSRQFLRSDGQWADTPNLPVGAFAFVQPQQLGTDWLLADGGVAKIADFPVLAATQQQQRNTVHLVHATGATVVTADYAGTSLNHLHYDPDTGHVVTLGSAGIAYSLDRVNFTLIARSMPSGYANPVLRNGVLAFHGQTTSGNYGWHIGRINGATFTPLGNAGPATNTSQSYRSCAVAGDQILLNVHRSSDSRSELHRVDTVSQTITRCSLPEVGEADFYYPTSRFLRIGGTTFFAAYLANPSRYRLFYSEDNGRTWAIATDAATGQPLDPSGIASDNVDEGDHNARHGERRCDVLADRAILLRGNGDGGWSSMNGKQWTAFSYLPAEYPLGITHENGAWYLGHRRGLIKTEDFVSFTAVATPLLVFGSSSYSEFMAAWATPGCLVVATQQLSYSTSSGTMRVRYSRDGGATWTVAYDYTSSVSGAQIRFNRELNYIPFRCTESSTEIYRYISTEPGLVGHGTAQGFSTNNGIWEVGRGDAFVTLTHNTSGVRLSAARNYDPATEFRLPTAPTLGGFTLNHASGQTLRYAIRGR